MRSAGGWKQSMRQRNAEAKRRARRARTCSAARARARSPTGGGAAAPAGPRLADHLGLSRRCSSESHSGSCAPRRVRRATPRRGARGAHHVEHHVGAGRAVGGCSHRQLDELALLPPRLVLEVAHHLRLCVAQRLAVAAGAGLRGKQQPRVSRRGCTSTPHAACGAADLDGDDRLVEVLVDLPLLLAVAHRRLRLLHAKSANAGVSASRKPPGTQPRNAQPLAQRSRRTFARVAASTCAGGRAGRGRGRGGPPCAPMLS